MKLKPIGAVLSVAIIGGGFLTLGLLLCICSCRRHRRAGFQTQTRSSNYSGSDDVENQTPVQATSTENKCFDPSLVQISMSELIAATNNFERSRYIGDGGFGVVYRANLDSGPTVAVKKLSTDAFQGLREFQAEMETLAQLRHPNIVKILGYCVSGPDRVLIYEYVERGSLDDWLYETTLSSDPNWPLTWPSRVNVVKGVANGLSYLHGLDRPIVHRDIKAGNVLLDLAFEAHIADFGLARTIEGVDSHKSTQAAGTMGYMPPEYKIGITAAKVEGDVYSFGVLMLEVATGRRPCSDVGLVKWARESAKGGNAVEALDVGIERSQVKSEDVAEFFKIACLCTAEQPKERPRMGKVIAMLSQIAAF